MAVRCDIARWSRHCRVITDLLEKIEEQKREAWRRMPPVYGGWKPDDEIEATAGDRED